MKCHADAILRWFVFTVGLGIVLGGTVHGSGDSMDQKNKQPFGLNENHPYGRLTSDYVTPHVAWGNPYQDGKIRTLVMAPVWSQRETVELAERLSLDYTPCMTETFWEVVRPAWACTWDRFFQAPPSVVHRAMREALQKDYDVIILGKLKWTMLSTKQRLQIVEKVASGTGLVYVNPAESHRELEAIFKNDAGAAARAVILDGVPLAQLPAFSGISGEKLVKAARFGKGRVVVLDYAEKVPTDEGKATASPCLTPVWDTTSYTKATDGPAPLEKLPEVQFVPYEYYQSLVAKAVVWAAGKDSPIQIQTNWPVSLSWPVENKPLTVSATGVTDEVLFRATVRDRYDPAVVFPLTVQERRRDGATFAMAPLPCGQYFLDVWVLSPDGKATRTWGSKFFTVIDEFVFGDITLKNVLVNAGDKLEGTLNLPRSLKADERLFLDLSDNYGRRIVTQEIASPTTIATFTMRMPPPLTTLHRLDARLVRGTKTVAIKSKQFPVRCRRRWDDFNEVSWGGAGLNHLLSHRSAQKVVHCDEVDAVDFGWAGAANVRNIALADAWIVPYQARFGCIGAGENHIMPVLRGEHAAYGCMSQPETLKQLQEWGEKQSAILGPYGPLAWTHGDETHYSADPDVCWCDSCQAVFRDYLRSVYPNLAALNAEWKTAYKDWKEVKPVTFKDAVKTGVYAPWVEHCLANDRIFANFYHKSGEALAAHDPHNRAGFDGCFGLAMPNGGIDWWRLSQNVGILQDYVSGEQSLELMRSFGHADQIRGQWYGTYGLPSNTVPFCHFFPWHMILHGMNSSWFFRMSNPGPLSGHAPDFTNLPFFASRAEALKTIKHGLGKLLLNSQRENDGIAIHFSEASRITDAVYANDKKNTGGLCTAYWFGLSNVNHALEDAGLQYQYLSYDQVANGDLNRSTYKVLIMPRSRSVSDAECKTIRKFVQDGGVVIADVLPATHNGHGTLLPKSLLADLFPSDKPGVVNSIGKGKTALIGETLTDSGNNAAAEASHWESQSDQSRKLADLLARTADIQPAVLVSSRKDAAMPPSEIVRFRCGAIQFVGLLRNLLSYESNVYPATIRFPSESHLYDVIQGKYLGTTREINDDLSYRVELYAMLPYRVRAVEIRGPDTCTAGMPASFAVKLIPEGNVGACKHVIRVEVIAPDGRNLAHYAVNAVTEKGAAEMIIPWALNDQPGNYTVTARDVVTGTQTQVKIKLTEVR